MPCSIWTPPPWHTPSSNSVHFWGYAGSATAGMSPNRVAASRKRRRLAKSIRRGSSCSRRSGACNKTPLSAYKASSSPCKERDHEIASDCVGRPISRPVHFDACCGNVGGHALCTREGRVRVLSGSPAENRQCALLGAFADDPLARCPLQLFARRPEPRRRDPRQRERDDGEKERGDLPGCGGSHALLRRTRCEVQGVRTGGRGLRLQGGGLPGLHRSRAQCHHRAGTLATARLCADRAQGHGKDDRHRVDPLTSLGMGRLLRPVLDVALQQAVFEIGFLEAGTRHIVKG